MIHKKFINLLTKRTKVVIKSYWFSKLTIDAKPEFISIFKSSQSISTLKLKSHFLVWAPKEAKDQLMIKNLSMKRNKLLAKQHFLKGSLICLEIRWSIMMIYKESMTMTSTSFREYLILVLYLRMQTQWIMNELKIALLKSIFLLNMFVIFSLIELKLQDKMYI